MKKTFIIRGIIFFVLAIFVLSLMFCLFKSALASQNITSDKGLLADEHPTKEEWLEVYITHKIKQWTDPWQRRIGVTVWIDPKEQVIAITLTSANGQEEISQSAKDVYIHDIESIVRPILKRYVWPKNYKLTVQYI